MASKRKEAAVPLHSTNGSIPGAVETHARPVPSGLLLVEVAGQSLKLDLTEVQVTTEAVERRHNATNDNPNWYTPEFLRDLAAAYIDLGIHQCTPTQAALLREAAQREYANLRAHFFSTPRSPGATE